MEHENWKKAADIYFTLLAKKSIDDTQELYACYHEPSVKQAVRTLTEQSGTHIIEAPKKLHLVSQATGSVYATNFTHLKEKYSSVESKKYFHLLSIIVMTFLSIIDHNEPSKVRFKREGITYFTLEKKVHELLSSWATRLKSSPSFALEHMMDMKSAVDTWVHAELAVEEANGQLKTPKRTRMGLIHAAMRLLEQEHLVVILDKDDVAKVIPKQDLFDRIDYLYHDYERYAALKTLMESESERDAENIPN